MCEEPQTPMTTPGTPFTSKKKVTVVAAVIAGGVAAAILAATIMGAPAGPLLTLGADIGGEDTSALDYGRISADWAGLQTTPGSDLSTEPGEGVVYQMVLPQDADQYLTRLGTVFQVPGAPYQVGVDPTQPPLYQLGPQDGSAPSLSLQWSGTGRWFYLNPAATFEPICEPAPQSPEEYLTCYEQELAASTGAPTEAQMRSETARLISASGFTVTADQVQVFTEPGNTYGVVRLTLDGVETAVDYGVGWSPDGRVAWAYGHAATAKNRGTYDTVSAVSAVQRLGDPRWYGTPGPQFGEGSFGDPAVRGSYTIVEAEATLLLVRDTEGHKWLVPGYAYPSPNRWWNTAISLADGVVGLPDPVVD
jgi:hypothetical protein